MHERDQRGQSPRVRQPQDRAGLGGTGEPRQRRHPRGRDARRRRQRDAQLAYGTQALQGVDQGRAAYGQRSGAQPVERGVAAAYRYDQQAFQPGLLLIADPAPQ